MKSAECSARRAGNIALGRADDTGARHAGKNRFCTQIGNEWFTWFRTRSSKSRLNFLDADGYTDYVLNDAAYDYALREARPASGYDQQYEGRTGERGSATRRPGRRISTGWASTR